MIIRILGTGEALDACGLGNTSSILHGKGVPTILFDCGYQIPERLFQLNDLLKQLDAIYLTHLHGDHIMGVACLLCKFYEEGRKRPLAVFGPRGVESYLKKLTKLCFPNAFKKMVCKISFKELKSGQSFVFKGLKFQCAQSGHSLTNLSVRVTGPNQKSFCISGDGNFTPATKKLFAGTDLLFHETFALKYMGPQHCDLETLKDYAIAYDVKQVGTVHTSRDLLKQVHAAVARLKKRDRRFFVAKPGMRIKN